MLTYCLLDEAWGAKPRYTTNQSCDLENSEEKSLKKETNIESFEDTEKPFEINSNMNCIEVLEHIKTCNKCYNKIVSSRRPMILDNMREIINDNKDLIVLILIGISIVLFFNLINNLTKD